MTIICFSSGPPYLADQIAALQLLDEAMHKATHAARALSRIWPDIEIKTSKWRMGGTAGNDPWRGNGKRRARKPR
jgi:hypothetical protein